MTTFATTRDFNATPAAVFAAMRDPVRLARWWGPAGFSNRFSIFEFRADGRWVFDMIAPDGTVYANESVFTRIVDDQELVLRHICQPLFTLSIRLEATTTGTRLHWAQTLDDAAVAEAIRHIVEPANEQNLDRLSAELERPPMKITVETHVSAPAASFHRAWRRKTAASVSISPAPIPR